MSDEPGDEQLLMVAGAVERPLEIVQRSGPVSQWIDLAGPVAGADHATVSSRDRQFRASIPLDVLRQGRLEGGRLRLPDPPTRCWDVKDVVRIELTVGSRPDSVPPGRLPSPRSG
jgi:hypothetical protein